MGLNLHNFLKRMQEKNVALKNLEVQNGALVFSTNYRGLKIAKRYVKLSNLQLCVEKTGGLKSLINWMFTHLGLFVGVLFWVIFSIVFNMQHIFVEVSGNINANDMMNIQAYVTEVYHRGVNLRELERMVMINFDIQNCSIINNGNVIIVNCYDSLKPQIAESIISPCDGIIAELNVFSGKAKVEVGQIVKKGQILVSGLKQDNRIVEPAEANIYISGWVSGVVDFFGSKIVYERTGKSVTSSYLNMFGIDLFNNFQPEYANFEIERSEVFISQNNLLPLKRVLCTCFEVVAVEKPVEFEIVKEELVKRSRDIAQQNLPANAQDIQESVIIRDISKDCKEVITYLKFTMRIAN